MGGSLISPTTPTFAGDLGHMRRGWKRLPGSCFGKDISDGLGTKKMSRRFSDQLSLATASFGCEQLLCCAVNKYLSSVQKIFIMGSINCYREVNKYLLMGRKGLFAK